MRISAYRGGPQQVRYGFAAVSNEPSPLPDQTHWSAICRDMIALWELVTDDEDGSAEATKRAVEKAWPCDQGAQTIKAKSPDEDSYM